MANKLAGQRAKFSKNRSLFYTTSDEAIRERACQRMAEVLDDAGTYGFTEEMVTQGEDVPDIVRVTFKSFRYPAVEKDERPSEAHIKELKEVVDSAEAKMLGEGSEWIYAYGYRCTPDRVKIGSTKGDVESRIAAQIATGTPDKPSLYLKIATHDCRALERAIQSILRIHGKSIDGAGAEWFQCTIEDVIRIYESAIQAHT